MSDWPNDSRGDVQAWGLEWPESARYHMRLSDYHAEWARRHSADADRYGRLARRWLIVALAAQAVAVLALIIGAAGR